MNVKIWIRDNDKSFVGYTEYTTTVKRFSSAKAIATKTAERFARVYGHYPKEYGAAMIEGV